MLIRMTTINKSLKKEVTRLAREETLLFDDQHDVTSSFESWVADNNCGKTNRRR